MYNLLGTEAYYSAQINITNFLLHGFPNFQDCGSLESLLLFI